MATYQITNLGKAALTPLTLTLSFFPTRPACPVLRFRSSSFPFTFLFLRSSRSHGARPGPGGQPQAQGASCTHRLREEGVLVLSTGMFEQSHVSIELSRKKAMLLTPHSPIKVQFSGQWGCDSPPQKHQESLCWFAFLCSGLSCRSTCTGTHWSRVHCSGHQGGSGRVWAGGGGTCTGPGTSGGTSWGCTAPAACGQFAPEPQERQGWERGDPEHAGC